MSLLDGMKDKLGFGTKPEWQDDGYQDSESDDYGYEGGEYAEGDYEQDSYEEDDGYSSSSSTRGSVVSFDAYNPSNFDNVKISSDNSPRVASYDDLGKSRFSSRAKSGYGSSGTSSHAGGSTRTSTSRAASSRLHGSDGTGASGLSAGGSSWTPSDPSFLDNQGPSYGARDVMDEIHAADPYSSLGSDFLNVSKDPASHLGIVRPQAYADVEKIATAAKAGKSVVLVVSETKPTLAKRILDFSFGVASALNMNVDKAADRVFVLSRGAEMLSEDERAYLTEQGILKDER